VNEFEANQTRDQNSEEEVTRYRFEKENGSGGSVAGVMSPNPVSAS